MKLKHALIVSAIVFTMFCILIGGIKREDAYNLEKREILLRNIGHEILLHSGDSTSRVLPVRRSGEHYQLRFENQFTFEPDALVRIIRETLAPNHANSDYIVKVKDCAGDPTVYGYSVSNHRKNDIVPCSGRTQPKGCYVLSIQFRDELAIQKYSTAGILLAFAIIFPVVVVRNRRKRTAATAFTTPQDRSLYIGEILFDVNKKCLITSSGTTRLTSKESKLLLIFAHAPNEVINRARLQKEIWEDDGVIVGRSLDVFISRLRKKLESDRAVQLINIHGKGYKLQIEN